ncbi:unnamed protein product [Didymodactylos carnosus]|nr:unnamed protein product [Didymodactylos carnosus]CAF4582816.1 unnamed protein product [Didymodactylos carnosus]
MFAKRAVFRVGYKGEICFEDPIRRCSCIEMLYGITDLKPGVPSIDEKDIKSKRDSAAKHYHPNKLSTIDDRPFIFLNLCASKLMIPKIRKHYLQELEYSLKKCEGRNYNDELCRDIVEDLNDRIITNTVAGKIICTLNSCELELMTSSVHLN